MEILRIESVITKEFPREKLMGLLQAVISSSRDNKAIIFKFSHYLSHPDIFSNVWKALLPLSDKLKSGKETFVVNFLELLQFLKFSKEVEQEVNFTAIEKRSFDYRALRKIVNKVWDNVMLAKYTETIVKMMLLVLLENILPHLDKPILLTDFLMESLDVGGTVALLALQGIFILIQKHNLAFPDIYNRVYALFEPNMFKLEYKTRLFQLADIFLSSTHLPENLVAAFAKRLSRLSIEAPASDVIVICRFIGNLIIRHPGLTVLTQRDQPGIISKDPYIMEESDPLKSRALESQLWEIHGMQRHFIPAVVKAASSVFKTLPDVEWDLTEALETDDSKLFKDEVDKAIKSEFRKVRIVQEAPKSFLSQFERELLQLHKELDE